MPFEAHFLFLGADRERVFFSTHVPCQPGVLKRRPPKPRSSPSPRYDAASPARL